MKGQISTRGQLIVLVLLLGAAAALWLGQDHFGKVFAAFSGTPPERGAAPADRKVPVVLSPVGLQRDDASIESIATARAKRFVTLYPRAEGEVVHLGVQAGQRVKQGDVVLRLEAEAAALAVELAKIRVDEAETMLDRSRQLLRSNVNPQAKVNDARNVRERARVELRQAEEQLGNRTLFAPFDGVVGIPKVEVGDRVTTTTAIVTMDDRSELLAEIQVPEEFLGRLAIGQKVEARTPSFPNKAFSGVVEKIDSRVDPTSRTVMVRAKLPNGEDLLRPGMSFAVTLVIPGRSYPAVPELALQWAKGESHVWRVIGDKAEKVTVQAVTRRSGGILVAGDLREGDLVVVEGVQRLRPGRAVRFARPDADSKARSIE